MKDLNELKIFKNNVNSSLKKEFINSIKDKEYENYIRSIHLPIEEIIKYTSRLETCFNEKKNCSNCKGLDYCKNEIYGFCLNEEVDKERLRFEYRSCKFKKRSKNISKSR